jgi:MFS family permease
VRRYLEVWRLSGAPVLILCGFLGRLPVTMLPLALLSAVHLRTGSWASAGIATGAYTVSLAVMAPVMGRLVDRRGPRPVLLVTGLLHPALLVSLVAALVSPLPIGVVYAGAAAAGASFPVVAPTVRSLWSQIAAVGSRERAAAFALDSVGGELSWVLGPLVVAGALLVASPVAALLVAAGVCLVGTIAVALSAPVRRWENRDDGARRAGGPLRARGMGTLLCGVGALMFSFGAMEVGLPAHAEHMGQRWLGGALLAVWSAGSAVSAVWFGTRHITRPLGDQWRWGLLAVAVAIVPLALAPRLWIAPFAFVLGATIAPVIIVQNGLVAELAPPGTTTEAFTWITTVAYGAGSLGTSVGGAVVEAGGVPGAFALATAAAVMAWACACTGRSRVRHAHDARRVLAEQAA